MTTLSLPLCCFLMFLGTTNILDVKAISADRKIVLEEQFKFLVKNIKNKLGKGNILDTAEEIQQDVLKILNAPSPCQIGIKETKLYGDSRYYVSTQALDNLKSNDKCKKNGGNLVTINSKEENEFLRKTLVNTNGPNKPFVWTGLYLDSLRNLRWYDNSPVNYTNLDPNANPLSHLDDSIICVIMNTATGVWDYYRCFNPDFFNRIYPKLPYVCEFKG